VVTDREFGNFRLTTLRGHTFGDGNGNRVQDAAESGLANVTIQLDLNRDGTVDRTTATDTAGDYQFDNVGPGTHTVSEHVPVGRRQTFPPDPGIYTIEAQSGNTVSKLDFGSSGDFFGNITVRYRHGELKIRGDSQKNGVRIEQADTGRIRVVALGATAINGQASPLNFRGVQFVDMRMGSGDDTAVFDGVTIRGRSKLNMDDGNDTVVLNNVRMGGAKIRTDTIRRNGHDLVQIIDSILEGKLSLTTRGGSDILEVEDSVFRKEVSISGGIRVVGQSTSS
jgi:hypothetical protein